MPWSCPRSGSTRSLSGNSRSGLSGWATSGFEPGGQFNRDPLDVVVARACTFLLGGVPLSLGLVERADVVKQNAFALVGVVPEMIEDVDKILRVLALEARLQIGRAEPLVVKVMPLRVMRPGGLLTNARNCGTPRALAAARNQLSPACLVQSYLPWATSKVSTVRHGCRSAG